MRIRFSALVLILALLVICTTSAIAGQPAAADKTTVNDKAALKKLLGPHMFSVQWVSWDYFGTATVTDNKGLLEVKGEQRSRTNGDFVTIDGVITEVNTNAFTFKGNVTVRVEYINNGDPCVRDGEMQFKIVGHRQYWRMYPMDSPCDEATDYVDIFFRAR